MCPGGACARRRVHARPGFTSHRHPRSPSPRAGWQDFRPLKLRGQVKPRHPDFKLRGEGGALTYECVCFEGAAGGCTCGIPVVTSSSFPRPLLVQARSARRCGWSPARTGLSRSSRSWTPSRSPQTCDWVAGKLGIHSSWGCHFGMRCTPHPPYHFNYKQRCSLQLVIAAASWAPAATE